MQILATLGRIYGADRMIPVHSVQISGVSYANLGEAGLDWLAEMAAGGGRAQVFTTLNPAGMDIENYRNLGISEEFAVNQRRVLEAFEAMGVVTTCSCTPYLFGNLPHFGEHIAWAESSAVCYANAVLGARTNREGGPSALAAALTGITPAYGYHLDENRQPTVHVVVEAEIQSNPDFGALGKAIGDLLQAEPLGKVPFITGISEATLENLKSFCASIATFGGVALFHIPGLTPEADQFSAPETQIRISHADLDQARQELNTAAPDEVDFVSLGCPHLTLREIQRIAELLKGQQVKRNSGSPPRALSRAWRTGWATRLLLRRQGQSSPRTPAAWLHRSKAASQRWRLIPPKPVIMQRERTASRLACWILMMWSGRRSNDPRQHPPRPFDLPRPVDR